VSKVLVFSTSTCSWCRRAKRYLKERGVPFKEINVGFDKEQIDRELARKAS
jgi:glutaredoxin